MSNKRKPSITDMPMLRYQLADLWDLVFNDEVPVAKAKALTGIATAMIKSVAIEQIQGQIEGEVREIDFLTTQNERSKQVAKALENAKTANTKPYEFHKPSATA